MPHPILAKLPEHLAIIQSLKKNPAKIVLCSLLATERDVIWGRFTSAQERIQDWSSRLKEYLDHDGDCIKCPSPCLLCHTLDDIEIADETIEESKNLLDAQEDKSRLLLLIEVLLLTQPEKKYNSMEEMHDQNPTYDALLKVFDCNNDLEQRIEKWRCADSTFKAEISLLCQSLLNLAQV